MSFVKLVFTVALKSEIPIDYLSSFSIPVYTLKALKSGILRNINPDKVGMLFVITGPGLENSKKAALWIRDNINPLYVINLGTCAAIGQGLAVGDLITAKYCKKNATKIKINPDLPLSVDVHYQVIENINSAGKIQKKELGFWDMEAFAQAKIFFKTDTSFHVLKLISDFGDEKTYYENLPKIRCQIAKTLKWIENMAKELAISVIIPVFNRQKLIKNSLDAILAQSMQLKEIIVINDGSTDGTINSLQEYKNKIRIIDFPQNKGVSAARNAGIKAAKGRWLAFCDSDDVWKPEKLERQERFLQKYPFYEIIQSQEIWIRQGTRVNQCKQHEMREGWIFEHNLNLCLISPSSVLMKKSIFDKFGLFDEMLPACEDYDLWLRITRKKVVGLEPSRSVIKFGGHSDQLSRKYEAIDRFRVQALMKAFKKEEDIYYKNAIRKVLEKKLNILLTGSVKREKLKEAEKYQKIIDQIRDLC
ncbi:glycosyltransferase [Candidatus Margulisiibacteriota bacterium]